MAGDTDVSRFINHASDVAHRLIYEYAAQFDKREDYRPLEQLATRVQHAVVESCVGLSLALREEAYDEILTWEGDMAEYERAMDQADWHRMFENPEYDHRLDEDWM